jgi:hypothetical protein
MKPSASLRQRLQKDDGGDDKQRSSDSKYINQMLGNPSVKEQADHRCGQDGNLKIDHRKVFCCSFHESETKGS